MAANFAKLADMLRRCNREIKSCITNSQSSPNHFDGKPESK